MARRILIVLGVAWLAAGCVVVNYRDPRQVDSVYEKAVREMDVHLAAEEYVAAARVARTLDRLRPEEGHLAKVLRESRGSDDGDVARLFSDSSLGTNLAWRVPIERPWWQKALLYVPDRVLDLLDCVSLDIGVGPGLWADVHVTRGFQITAGTRANLAVGWFPGRNLGTQVMQEEGLLVMGPGSQTVYGFGLSGANKRVGSSNTDGMHFSNEDLYQELRDYWAIGLGAQLLLVGADADIHVIQIADFFAGIFTVDLLNDDMATTQPQPLHLEAFESITRLHEILLDERSLREYREWLAEGKPIDGLETAAPTDAASDAEAGSGAEDTDTGDDAGATEPG